MKKKIFMVLSAVTVLTMGILVVACSKDSNALNPNEEVAVEEIMPAPTLQKTNSAAEWAAFNLEIEKLNAKYLTPEIMGKAMRVGMDSGDVTTKLKDRIVKADRDGAGVGIGAGATIGVAAGGAGGGFLGALAGGAIIGAIFSISEWWCLSGEGCMISINPLTSIDGLESDSIAALIGEQHNAIIEDFMKNPLVLTGVSDTIFLQDITERYERLFGVVGDSIKSSINTLYLNKKYDFSVEVEKVVGNLDDATKEMDIAQQHDYTEEYLEIVNATLSESEEKNQVAVSASVSYYSSAMWKVQ